MDEDDDEDGQNEDHSGSNPDNHGRGCIDMHTQAKHAHPGQWKTTLCQSRQERRETQLQANSAGIQQKNRQIATKFRRKDLHADGPAVLGELPPGNGCVSVSPCAPDADALSAMSPPLFCTAPGCSPASLLPVVVCCAEADVGWLLVLRLVDFVTISDVVVAVLLIVIVVVEAVSVVEVIVADTSAADDTVVSILAPVRHTVQPDSIPVVPPQTPFFSWQYVGSPGPWPNK